MKSLNVLLLISIVLISGCWDRKEMNDLAFVTGTALDLTEDGNLLCTIQIAIPASPEKSIDAGSGKKGNYFIISAEGKSGNEIHRLLQKKSSRHLFLSHRSVVFISERLARNGLRDVLDIFTHDPRNRLKTYLMIVKEGEARDILKMSNPLKQVPLEVVKEIRESGDDVRVTLRDFYIAHLGEGVQPVVGDIVSEEPSKDPEHQIFAFAGASVFKDLKLVGHLDVKETLNLLWMTGKLDFGRITSKLADGTGEIGVLLNHVDSKVIVESVREPIKFKVKLKGVASLVENNSALSVNNPDDLASIQSALKGTIVNQMEQLVNKLQKKYKTDSAGFGQEIYNHHPKTWMKLRDRWDSHFSKAQISFEVDLNIQGAGMIHSTFESSAEETMK